MDKSRRNHERFHAKNEANKSDSGLEKPEATVLEQLRALSHKKQLQILDLCCGTGRNAIPLAEALQGSGSRIVCVDSKEQAVENLRENAKKRRVNDLIYPLCQNVHAIRIEEKAYDYIISWSCLEHLKKHSDFEDMLPRIKKGTAPNGINCFLINAAVSEYDTEEALERKALIELNFRQDKLIGILSENYSGWKILKREWGNYINYLHRYGRKIIFKSRPLVFCAQRNE